MKPRLSGPGGAANPRNTCRDRCGLRLAPTRNAATSFGAAIGGAGRAPRRKTRPKPPIGQHSPIRQQEAQGMKKCMAMLAVAMAMALLCQAGLARAPLDSLPPA